MPTFKIVLDSSSNFDFELAKKYDIELIPYNIQMDEKHYKDLVDITSREFFQKMGACHTLKTAIPSPQEIGDFLTDLESKGVTQVLFITTSQKLTGMQDLVHLVARSHPNLEIAVVDSRQAGATVGLIGIYADKLRSEGKDFNTVVDTLNRKLPDASIHALFRTLEYVIRGGRLSKVKGAIGMMLKIQPVLTISDGEITITEKMRGIKRSREQLITNIRKKIASSRPYYFALFSGDNEEELAILKTELDDVIAKADVYFEKEFTPVLGVHGGPNAIGASVFFTD